MVTAPLRIGRPPITLGLRANRPLLLLVAGVTVALIVALIGLVVDPRVITGAPAWLKPAKFALSIAIYAATLSWLLRFVPDRPRLTAAIGWAALAGFGIEMALIALQAARGTTSHFNLATPFDSVVFRVMGIVIAGMWLLTAVVAALLFRRRFALPPVVWGVRLGLVGGLLGMAVAVLMTLPTPEQATALAASGGSSIVGAHSVGTADGGPGLPIVGWSTVGGDLRVAHFFGIHAMQALPLVGLVLASRAPEWLSMRDRTRLVGIAGGVWFSATLVLTWQALRGQPVISPDGLTLVTIGAIAAVAISAAAVLLGISKRQSREPGQAFRRDFAHPSHVLHR